MPDMRYKPLHLPQVSAPFTIVMERLNKDGIECEELEINPEELKPMQGIVFSDEVGNFNPEEMNPIWISNDNEVIDGHHRFMRALMENKPIKAIKTNLNGRDSARALNKVQDIFDYEEQRKMEEVVTQDVINMENQQDSGISDNEFYKTLEETKVPEGNKIKIIGFREQPIMENSIIGNFFLLDPSSGYDQYEIEFENLLDTNDLGVNCVAGEIPVDTLVKAWFPNVDFEQLEQEHNVPSVNMKNKAIAERAQKLGYDGIKYGNLMVQGLK